MRWGNIVFDDDPMDIAMDDLDLPGGPSFGDGAFETLMKVAPGIDGVEDKAPKFAVNPAPGTAAIGGDPKPTGRRGLFGLQSPNPSCLAVFVCKVIVNLGSSVATRLTTVYDSQPTSPSSRLANALLQSKVIDYNSSQLSLLCLTPILYADQLSIPVLVRRL